MLRSFLDSIKHFWGSVAVPQKPFKTLNQLPLHRLFQIILSVFPSNSDASTHFQIEIPSIYKYLFLTRPPARTKMKTGNKERGLNWHNIFTRLPNHLARPYNWMKQRVEQLRVATCVKILKRHWLSSVEHFCMPLRQPCWCSKQWNSGHVGELSQFCGSVLSFVPTNLPGCWSREWNSLFLSHQLFLFQVEHLTCSSYQSAPWHG